MQLRKYVFVLALLAGLVSILIVLLNSRWSQTTDQDTDALMVTVSILPQRYIVERVGGEYVQVSVMVLPGESPATYEPGPEQIRALTEALAYFRIGVPFEDAWMDRIMSVNSEMMVVDTTQGIERIPMGTEDRNLDPHIWLSPSLVNIQAQTICDTLVKLDPSHAHSYKSNLEAFQADIHALDDDIRSLLEGLPTRTFMVFHPAWGYFAREYDLEMIAIEMGGQEPSAAELAELISVARQDGIGIIFAQPEFDVTEAEIITREIGAQVLLIDPLSPDWLNNLHNVANLFAEMMGQEVS